MASTYKDLQRRICRAALNWSNLPHHQKYIFRPVKAD